jgi:hypothetical protein
VPGRKPDDPTFTPQGREIYERLKEATEGKYEIIRELGRGGMAVVFLGYQKSLDREVAIKVLLPLLGYDPEIVERFTREARTQGRLDHPNIIQVYEIYNEGGLTFFTVPYISGESIRVFLQDYPQPPLEKVFRYLTQAADALAYAHRRGVVHRDVKPDNILVDKERDRVVLTDFGIAKALTAEKTLTTPGDLLGTPQYMSPEQGEGRHDLDGRADQYSLGLVGYEMLAGRRPFLADNLAELMYKHRFEEPLSLDDIRPDAPRHLRQAIHRAICKDRDERFPTMDAFLAALEGPWEVERAEEDEEGRTEPMAPPGSEATTVRVGDGGAGARARDRADAEDAGALGGRRRADGEDARAAGDPAPRAPGRARGARGALVALWHPALGNACRGRSRDPGRGGGDPGAASGRGPAARCAACPALRRRGGGRSDRGCPCHLRASEATRRDPTGGTGSDAGDRCGRRTR